MQYAERFLSLPSPQPLVATIAALALGTAVGTGGYALIDSEQVTQTSPNVVVVDPPVTPSGGVMAKDEAATAAAIGGGIELRGSKASAIGTPGP
jgi:hypothetical protein